MIVLAILVIPNLRELLEGVNAVLRGEQFVSARFAGHDFTGASDAAASHSVRSNAVVGPLQQDIKIAHHEVGFYSDDRRFLGGCRCCD